LAQAGRDVALLLVGRGKGLPLLLRGVEMEDIHQADGEIRVGGEGREAKDRPNHGFGSSLMIPFTINMNHMEAGSMVAGRGEGRCSGSRFGLLGTTP